MILFVLIGELRLQEDIFPPNQPGAIDGSQRLAYAGFEVVPPLVGCINAAKPAADREFRQRSGPFFFPSGTIKNGGDGISRVIVSRYSAMACRRVREMNPRQACSHL